MKIFKKLLLQSFYFCAEVVKASVDILIAAVDLVDVVDDRGAFCRQSCDEQCHAGTDIG